MLFGRLRPNRSAARERDPSRSRTYAAYTIASLLLLMGVMAGMQQKYYSVGGETPRKFVLASTRDLQPGASKLSSTGSLDTVAAPAAAPVAVPTANSGSNTKPVTKPAPAATAPVAAAAPVAPAKPPPVELPPPPLKFSGTRMFKTDDAYLMIGTYYFGMAALPQILIEAGRLAAALGRVFVEPCVSGSMIVPCSCAPKYVRGAPLYAPEGWQAAMDAADGKLPPAAACGAGAGSVDSEVDDKTFPVLDEGASYRASAFVAWDRVAAATGARTIQWEALCASLEDATKSEQRADPTADIIHLPVAYCGASDKGICEAAQTKRKVTQVWVQEWKQLLPVGLEGDNVLKRLGNEGAQLLGIYEYAPGSLRVPAPGGSGSAGVAIAAGGELPTDVRAGLAVAAARAIPWSTYHECRAVAWMRTKFGSE